MWPERFGHIHVMDSLDDPTLTLCEHLQPIYELEVALGNRIILRYKYPEGPVSFVLKRPLDRAKIGELHLHSVKWWENHDTHYPIEGGFSCDEHKVSVSGPLEGEFSSY